jgi:hypothetical protein
MQMLKTTVIDNEKDINFLRDFISNFDYDYFDSIYKPYKKNKTSSFAGL